MELIQLPLEVLGDGGAEETKGIWVMGADGVGFFRKSTTISTV